jgi:hypothetical protein
MAFALGIYMLLANSMNLCRTIVAASKKRQTPVGRWPGTVGLGKKRYTEQEGSHGVPNNNWLGR